MAEQSTHLPARIEAQLAVTSRFASTLTGLMYEEARRRAEGRGFEVQKVTPRTRGFTLDLNSLRIRCKVNDDDVVTEVHAG
jgi:hypothetical protein